MNKLDTATLALAKASNGNPIISTLTVMLFYLAFNQLEAVTEQLIFGERFVHWLDPIFMCAFIAYAAYGVWMCAAYQLSELPEAGS